MVSFCLANSAPQLPSPRSSSVYKKRFCVFFRWLKLMEKDADTVEQYGKAVQYLLSCFEIENISHCLIDVFVLAYRNGSLQGALGSSIFKETKSFQCKVHNGVAQAIEWMLLECHKQMRVDDARFLELLKRDVLAPLKKQNAKKRKVNTISKRSFDFKRLQELPPTEVIKKVVTQALIILCCFG